MKTDPSELKRLARKLYKHYQGKLLAEATHSFTSGFNSEPLEAQPNKVQTSFQRAALSCDGAGAKPRDWVESQFVKFEEYAKYFNKRIIPQPQQLYGLNAQVRYVAWKVERRAEEHRDKQKLTTIRATFAIDERNLKALCRTLRMPETDVLCEKPEEFTVGFLKSKGIYSLVSDKRDAAIDGALS